MKRRSRWVSFRSSTNKVKAENCMNLSSRAAAIKRANNLKPKPWTCLAKVLAFLLVLLIGQGVFLENSAYSDNSKNEILVLPLQVKSQNKDETEKQLPILLRESLESKGFAVTDQETSQSLLSEQEVRTMDVSIVRRLTKMAGADYGLYGLANQENATLDFDLRLVSSAEDVATKSFNLTQKPSEDLSNSTDRISGKIRDYLSSKQTISEIEITGNEIVDNEFVLNRLDIQKGDYLSKEKINSDIKRLYKSGSFEDVKTFVQDTDTGKRVVFQVEEKPLIKDIIIKGNKNLDDSEILDAMQTETGTVLNSRTLSQDLRKIKQLYRKDGHYKVDLSHEQEEVAQRKANLIIQVEEGEQLYINKIKIKGAEKIDPATLRDQLSISERWFFSWITGGGILKEDQLNRDVAVLKSYYAQKGFIEVKIAQPRVKVTKQGINIIFQVVEGPRYRVKDVSLEGELISPRKKLLQLIQMDQLAAKDKYFDRSVMNKDRENLTNYYTDYGYAYASTNIDLDKNKEDNTVSITYTLNKKQMVYIRRLEIAGNRKTKDNVIRREMLLTAGTQFSGDKLSRSKQNLQRLGFFKSIDINTLPTGESNKMDLKVDVEEKSTGSFSAGAGYSSIDRAFFTAKLQERNFLGKGYNISLQGKYSSETTRFQLSFWNPHLYNGPLGMGFDAYNTSRIYDDYDLLNTGGKWKFAYTIGDYTRLYWNIQLSRYEVSDVDDFANPAIDEGENWSRSASVSVKRDTTNRRYAPTKGTKNQISTEYSGGILGGDDDYIKAEYDFSYYYTPIWKFTLNWHWNAGRLFENQGEEVPDFERFYLGGLNSVRGYDYRDISSTEYDKEGDYSYDVGGYKFFQTNYELYFPLKEDIRLMGVFFFDAGNVWDKSEDVSLDFFRSYGAGIRWNSPMGPLRLEYAIPIDDLKDNSRGFEFSIGGFF